MAALSNYLTRQEWNLAYFLGVKAAMDRDLDVRDLSDQLRAGIAEAARLGYVFRGVEVDAAGEASKVRQVEDLSNARVLVECLEGTLDRRGRAKELVVWAPTHAPSVDLTWLADVLAETEGAAAPAGSKPQGEN